MAALAHNILKAIRKLVQKASEAVNVVCGIEVIKVAGAMAV